MSWKNFPLTPADFRREPLGKLKTAGFYLYSIRPCGAWSPECLLHPYDQQEWRKDFVKRFTSPIPSTLKKETHPNGHAFLPYEAYFNYWKIYIFVEALDRGEDIENFLSPEQGRATVISRFATVSKGVTDCQAPQLEDDLERLLILFGRWKYRLESGSRYYLHAIELLRQDIYFVLEWLCRLTNKPEKVYFQKWSYESRVPERWADLTEVLSYEEFELQKMFERLVPFYAETLVKAGYLSDIQSVCTRLSNHESFGPWSRAFTDLHKSLNPVKPTQPIIFKQPRLLDHLLVIAIRTEILIRSLFRKAFATEDDRDFRKVFEQLSQEFPEDSKPRCIFGSIADKATWNRTELSGKPSDIFGEIDRLPLKKNWSHLMHHIFTSILRLVTARNYFAHHSYEDERLNQTGDLAGKVLKSCVESVVYVELVTHGRSLSATPVNQKGST